MTKRRRKTTDDFEEGFGYDLDEAETSMIVITKTARGYQTKVIGLTPTEGLAALRLATIKQAHQVHKEKGTWQRSSRQAG